MNLTTCQRCLWRNLLASFFLVSKLVKNIQSQIKSKYKKTHNNKGSEWQQRLSRNLTGPFITGSVCFNTLHALNNQAGSLKWALHHFTFLLSKGQLLTQMWYSSYIRFCFKGNFKDVFKDYNQITRLESFFWFAAHHPVSVLLLEVRTSTKQRRNCIENTLLLFLMQKCWFHCY